MQNLFKFTFIFLVLTTISCVIAYIIDPSIMQYTPENPVLFNKQKDFAWISIVINSTISYLIIKNEKFFRRS